MFDSPKDAHTISQSSTQNHHHHHFLHHPHPPLKPHKKESQEHTSTVQHLPDRKLQPFAPPRIILARIRVETQLRHHDVDIPSPGRKFRLLAGVIGLGFEADEGFPFVDVKQAGWERVGGCTSESEC